MNRSRAATAAWVAAGALTIAGAVMTTWAVVATPSATFGWFAYQPLASSVLFPPGFVMLSHAAVFGTFVTIVGLLTLSFLLGRHLGRAHTRHEQPTDS
ncbi:hypothetical protein GE115_09545 [Agromyces sp. CFH 90414]|uniref:Uncharacterized protein n=1 Tax=Agromyces agglutinans TaxID=2662258 RepID=A0A6I2F602_9MICO|nr:hypothetical protein [Agromyces agglutinans]MRG60112.1 hypothetical protein [Agromyces agglutinans]